MRPGAGPAVTPGGGWRARVEAKQQAGTGGDASPPATAQPAPSALPPRKEEPSKDDDGFQTVADKKNVWRPRRGRA